VSLCQVGVADGNGGFMLSLTTNVEQQ